VPKIDTPASMNGHVDTPVTLVTALAPPVILTAPTEMKAEYVLFTARYTAAVTAPVPPIVVIPTLQDFMGYWAVLISVTLIPVADVALFPDMA